MAEKAEKKSLEISQWLMAGPVEMLLPAFHEEGYPLKELLKFEEADLADWRPAESRSLAWQKGVELSWKPASAPGELRIDPSDKETPEVAYLAVYLRATRWVEAELVLKSAHLLRAYLDGARIAEKESSDSAEMKPLRHSLKLEPGKHLLLIKALRDPQNEAVWSIQATLEIAEAVGEEALRLETSPRQVMDIARLLEGPKVAGVSLSGDGTLAGVSLSQVNPETGSSERWLEIYRLPEGQLLRTFRGGTAISGVRWAPGGAVFAYTQTEKDKTTLWVVDMERGTSTPLLKDVKDFGDFTWADNGRFIVYSVTEKPEADSRGVKRLVSPRDRWPTFREKSYLYRVNIPQGTRQRLTAGKLTTSLSAISPDGRSLLFTRTVDDYQNRPYTKTVLATLDLTDLSVDTLLELGWLNAVEMSPDGKTLLLIGGPNLFGDLGRNVPEGFIANDYDGQAYLYDLANRKASAISRDFAPAIEAGYWDYRGKHLYFRAVDGEYVSLFRYYRESGKFEKIDTGLEALNEVRLAAQAPAAVYYGSGVSTPHRAQFIDLKKDRYQILADPAREDFGDVEFGTVQRWTFQNGRGAEIEGRVYYPPDFDPARQYPALVYYYGGTSAVTRNFGGRYPFNLFAAQGYVVYVLQPSGAPGFGQAFSALHVNDWGQIVAEEIISGTEKFLAAHPFVDKKRVGCIGASYGGFMTMLLITKTDQYATAIAHAGISALSSYWGEGFWGYLYSSVAAANSFPWNRRDLYVDQSPLFNADKVNTPLLLLHGEEDTNVPPGESDQFYTALKLLGKEVEYVRVAGQDHHILDYKKRIVWQKTILAWFDRWLKDQPEWWNSLYPDSLPDNF